MSPDECLQRACEAVPGLEQGALALLPEGLLIGEVGPGSSFEREPLVRCAARCLSAGATDGFGSSLIEHVFMAPERLVVLMRGQRHPRLALALSCSRAANLALVVTSTRNALRELEGMLDPAIWEL